jgi:putative hemolysin
MNLSLILLLITLNALFALSEMALVSSRSARLQSHLDDGHKGAQLALELRSEPSRFLSTIQVGITTVGVLSGALGEAAIADPVAQWLQRFPAVAAHASGIALALAVVLITYLTVVLGELVPKRLALRAPERIAMVVARPMRWLDRLSGPVVWLLARSSDLVLRLLPGRAVSEPPVTDEEIAALMVQGTQAGIFHASEQQLVENVLQLDERRVTSIMTPRREFASIYLDDPEPVQRAALAESVVNRIVVYQGDELAGIVEATALLRDLAAGRPLDVGAHLQQPLTVPETSTTSALLRVFREERTHFALVTDEYGEVQGLVTDADLLEAIIAGAADFESGSLPGVQRRDANSWLVDGALGVDRFRELCELALPEEDESADYSTVAGLVLDRLGRIPVEAEVFEWRGLRFEVVDMDGRRIDKVLVTRLVAGARAPPDRA